MIVSAVIPWRDTGCEHRRRNLAATIAHLKRGGIEATTSDDGTFEQFNVSAARNRGVESSTADVVIVNDADVIVPTSQLLDAARIAHTTGEVVTCYNRISYLTEAGTRALNAGQAHSGANHVERVATTPFGGANAITKSTHAYLGGWDEKFTGWGHEDSEFNERAAASVGHRALDGHAHHQWHPEAPKDNKHTNHHRWMESRARIAATPTLSIVRRVRPGNENPELRYSNRSLVNLPHRDMWIIGYQPTWVAGVNHIEGDAYATKWENIWDNVRLACQNPDISDPFILMDDDMFIMRPARTIPYLHRGPLADALNPDDASAWKQSLGHTFDWCEANGIGNPLNYELHIPYVVHKAQALEALDKARNWSWPLPPQARSVDGNYWQRGGIQVADVKIGRRLRGKIDTTGKYLSTEDQTFRNIYPALSRTFPTPSPYEVGGITEPGHGNPAIDALRASRRGRGTATQRARAGVA